MTGTPINPTYKKPFPAQDRSIDAALKLEIMKAINVCKVGKILSFDPGVANSRGATVDVQIAQQQVTSVSPTGVQTLANYTELRSVPVVWLGGGGVTATWPIKEGDECLVIFHDRHMDDWFVNGPGLPPGMGRLHDIADAFALVGIRSGPRALGGISTTAAQLRTDDGTSFIEMGIDGHITITTPGALDLNANAVAITASSVTFNVPTVTMTGNLTVDGILLGNGIRMDTHVHTNVQNGPSDTGGPI